jgi:hypothetical protein
MAKQESPALPAARTLIRHLSFGFPLLFVIDASSFR